MLNGWGKELHMSLLSANQTMFRVPGSEEKQITIFQESKEKKVKKNKNKV